MKIVTNEIRSRSRISIIVLLVLAVSTFIGCPFTSHKTLDVEKIQALSQLATVEYKLTKIVKSAKSGFWGTKKILFQVGATVKAGIDMAEIKEQDVTVLKDSIAVKLPKPGIVYLQIRPEDITQKYHEHGLIVRGFTEKEINEILRLGEDDIRKTIEKDTDILNAAGKNAKTFIEAWLANLDLKKTITVTIKDK